MHNMGKTIGEIHAMLIEYEKGLPKKAETPQVMMIKSGKIQKANKKSLNAKGKNKVNGKGKDKKVYIPKPNNPKSTAKERPAKDDACHHCKEVGHWKRNCPVYLAELQKKRKQVGSASSSGIFTIELFSFPNNNSWVYDTGCGTNICITKQGFRIERKLKQGALYLYVGNGVRAQVEAIGSFDLVLPNGLVICLDNCHYAPTITRGVVSVSRLVDNGFVQCFTDCGISVSKNGVLYFNAVPRNGIYEIDMHDLVPNVNSIYNVSNKRVKHNLDSTYLWHCRLAHINKKRIKQLQQDGLLKSTDDESFDKCESCLSGKMTKKPFLHSNERAKDLLGIIHTDVCGPLRHVSRQGASYFITFTDDYSRYGYVYLLKHKHEVFETFKVFKNEVENQLGKTIKAIRSDRGGEYISQEFKDYLKANGIVQQLTPPYTPQHNGVSERRNRTLLDMVRSMMNLTTLPLSFWDYALTSLQPHSQYVQLRRKRWVLFSFPPENKIGCCKDAEFPFEMRLISSKKSVGGGVDLEVIQEEERYNNLLKIIATFPQRWRVLNHTRGKVEEHSLGDLGKPANYKAAMLDSESNKWIDAINAEMQSMMDNMVWVLVDLPPGCKTVGSRWFFKKKTDMDAIVHVYKARLVVKGYTQLYGVDYEETLSPVADIRAIRILISITTYYDYEIWQMDVKTAFLNGYLDEDIYMVQPEGFVDPNHPRKVCKLQRSIYGLKQASRSWNKRFDEEIKRFGFTQNLDEPCVYQKASGSNVTFLILYVDDIIIMGNHIPSLQSVKDYLGKCFAMKDLGEAAFILGIKIYRDRSKRLIGLCQNAYMDKILKRYKMDNSKRGHIPMSKKDCDLNKSQVLKRLKSPSKVPLQCPATESEYIALRQKQQWKLFGLEIDLRLVHYANEPEFRKAPTLSKTISLFRECVELGGNKDTKVHTEIQSS
ncbi:retrotransposon protein, putative, ty1-copia subclass [Tanacetum coccineum]